MTLPSVTGSRRRRREQHQQQRLLAVQPVLGLIEDAPTPSDSKTSAVTSSPRCAGRQCMKSAPGLASDISASLTWYGANIRRRSVGLGFLAHRRPGVGVDRVGAGHRIGGVGEQPQPRAVARDAGRLLHDRVRQLIALGAGDVDVHARASRPHAPATSRRCCRRRRRRWSGRAACPSAPAASGSRPSPGTGARSSVSALTTCSRGARGGELLEHVAARTSG